MNAIERFYRRRKRRLDARGIRLDADWEEEKHPRGKDGKFTSGGGESGGAESDTSSSKPMTTKNGVSYPKTKGGAKYAPTVAQAEKEIGDGTAEKPGDGFQKQFESTIKKLKSSDIVYQMVNGKQQASVPGLAAKVDNKVQFKDRPAKSAEVQAIYDKARKSEPQISRDMVDLAAECGSNMSGLEFSCKSGSHFAEKIDRKREEAIEKGKTEYAKKSDEEIAAGLSDTVRYTMMSKHGDIAKNAESVIKGLQKKGYKIKEIENKFTSKNGKPVDYHGVHLDVVSPDGQRFEVQIHSEETLALKNKNHEIYEKVHGKDNVKRTPAEKAKLIREMQMNASKDELPPGITKLRSRKFDGITKKRLKNMA